MTFEHLLNLELIRLHGVAITPGALLTALVILLIGWGVSVGLQRAVRRTWNARRGGDSRNLHAMLRLGHYAVMFVTVLVALETIGIDLTALFAAGAVFAIGLGFAMQTVAQNFVAGVILLLERTIRPGDLLEVEGAVVRVQRIAMRSTLVRTRFEEEMIVPNSLLVQSTIKNFTLHDALYRVRATIGVAYSSDLRVVITVLERTARDFAPRYAAHEPVVLLTGFGSSSVDFEVSVWTDDPWNARRLLSDLNGEIWWALEAANVTIAFPQQDVHFDESVVGALTALSGPRRESA